MTGAGLCGIFYSDYRVLVRMPEKVIQKNQLVWIGNNT